MALPCPHCWNGPPMRTCPSSRPTRCGPGSSIWTPAFPPGADIDSVEPGPELAILSDDERGGPRGSCGRASAAGSRGAGPRCGRSSGDSSTSRPPRCGSGPPRWASPSSIEGRALSNRSASTSRIPPDWGWSPSATAARSGRTSSTLRPITEAERIVASFFTAAEQAAFATIPEPDRARGVPAGLDPQGGGAQGIRHGDLRPVGTARDRVRHIRADAALHARGARSASRPLDALGSRAPARLRRRAGR